MKLRQLPLLFLLPSLRKNLNPRCRRKVMRRIVHRISRPTRRNRLIHTDGETTADPLLEDQQTINAADDEATAVTETDTDKIESSETEFTDEPASSEMPTAEPSFTPEPTETPNPVASPEPMETLRPESSPKPSGPPLLLSRITILDEPALMMVIFL